uniref:Uncharacterized protein n=1 Tax=Leersia perrieri TaxID=77586 RepID=A0A0D9WRL9_9ORYZ
MSVQVSGSTRRLGLSAAPRILRLLIPSQSRVRLQQAAVLRLLRQPQAAAPVAPRQLPPFGSSSSHHR